jgi:uncharacterized protein (UPF0147 family)
VVAVLAIPFHWFFMFNLRPAEGISATGEKENNSPAAKASKQVSNLGEQINDDNFRLFSHKRMFLLISKVKID